TDVWGEPIGVYGFWTGLVIAASLASLMMLYRWNFVSKKAIATLDESLNPATALG
ncbi:MAG: MATE family multidrug resistance protein, partial [Patiriisocius sp.]